MSAAVNDLAARLRSNEIGLEYAAADEIERLEAALATARADALREAAAEFPDRVRWFSPEETRSIILALISQEPRA